jgi:hypothetical protein
MAKPLLDFDDIHFVIDRIGLSLKQFREDNGTQQTYNPEALLDHELRF